MPWKKSEVESHIKGLDDKQKEAWVKIANSTLASCLADGGDDCEGKAIRVANAMSKKVKESMEITEVGKTISAATESKIRAAISALEELLGSSEQESLSEKDKDPDIGGGVDRDKIPAEDFAGKNRSFPIVTPEDVSDAASSIGRAGADNYDTDTLKANIIKIVKRKGKAFMAQLPKAWQEEKESAEAELLGDCIPLVESVVREDGTIPIKIIAPGWGASGYYSPQVLERAASTFKSGLHMHLDHPTAKEEAERPERSVKDLAAVLTSDARWESDGPKGPGLYGEAKVFEPYREVVNELAPHIGVSIIARGKAKQGEAEGRKGSIIEEVTSAKSVDFVTAPGAGGQIIQLFESARERLMGNQNMEVKEVSDDELKALKEAKEAAEAENARLKEALLLREAEDFARETLAKIEMPDMTRDRLVASLAKAPDVTDGKLDTEKFGERIKEAAKTELEYLAKVGGTGTVKGMGASGSTDGTDLKESFRNMYLRQGKSAEEAEKLATLAAAGR